MKKIKKISKLLLCTTLPFVPVVALAATSGGESNNTSNGDRSVVNNPQVVGNVPNSIIYINKDNMTFANPQHYQYNFKDGTWKSNYYFNQGFERTLYGDKDYSIATIKMKGERDNKLENQDLWYESEQEWEVTFNRTAPFLQIEGYDFDMWSSSPRFGIVLSKALEFVEDSVEITVYKSTQSEEVYEKLKAPRITNDLENLEFKMNNIVKDIPIPNKYNSEWLGYLTSYNRWTSSLVTWEGDDRKRLEPTWKPNPIYEDLLTDWRHGASADSQPIRAYFIDNWRSELEDLINKKGGNRFWYPPKSIVDGTVKSGKNWPNNWQMSKKFRDNVGTILGFGYNTGPKPTLDFNDQNWFKITFKTRKNQLMFDKKNTGGLAYVMAGWTTYDKNVDVYSFNWKAADVNPNRQNYSIDIKEFKEKDSKYKLPNSVSYQLVRPAGNGLEEAIVPEQSITLSDNGQRNNVDTWYSRIYNSFDKAANPTFWTTQYNGQNKNIFETWQLKPTISISEEDIWDIITTSKVDPNDSNRLIFEVKYVINDLKLQKENLKQKLKEFKYLNTVQKEFYVNKLKTINDANDLKKLLDTENNAGEIKDLDDKMGELKDLYEKARNLRNGENFANYDQKYKAVLDEVLNNISTKISQNLNKREVQGLIDEVKTLWEYYNSLEKIATFTNLTKDQKTKLNKEIQDKMAEANAKDADKVSSFKTTSSKGDSINQLMKQLTSLKAAAEKAKTTNNYNLSTDDKKTNLDNTLAAVSQANTSVDKEQITTLITNLRNALDALDGDKNLNDAKAKGKEELAKLTHLNESQKTLISNKISEAHTVEQVKALIKIEENGSKGSANLLNEKMQKLRELITSGQKATNSEDQNYTNYDQATSDKKAALDNALKNAKDNLNTVGDSLEKVTDFVTKLETALNKLDGNTNLQTAKGNAINAINNPQIFPNLNQAQKDALIALINSKNTLSDVEAIVGSSENNYIGTAKDLDNAMKYLKEEIAASEAIKNNDKYYNASVKVKNDFDTKFNEVSGKVNDNLTLEQSTKLKEDLKNEREALDGVSSDILRNELISKVSADSTLSPVEKQILLDKIKKAKSNDELNKINTIIDALSAKMDELVQKQAKANAVKNGLDYENAADAFKKALNNQIKKNAEFLNDVTNDEAFYNLDNLELINAEIDKLKKQTQDAIENLKNSAKNHLAESKTNAASAIEALEYLNNAQKQALKEQLNNVTTIAPHEETLDKSVDEVLKEANDVNGSMKALSDFIKKQIQKGNGSDPLVDLNYVDADSRLKTNFVTSYSKAKQALNKQNGKNLSNDEVKALLATLKNDFAALNGKTNRQNKVNELQNLVNGAADVKNGEKFQNSSAQKQEQYNNAIANGEKVLKNKDNQTLNQIKEAINTIKDALLKIQNNKEDLKNKINNLPNLNNKEKENFISEISKHQEDDDQIYNIYKDALDKNDKKQKLIDLIDEKENLSEEDKVQLKEHIKNSTYNSEEELNEAKENINNLDASISDLLSDENENLTNEKLDSIIDQISNIHLNNNDYLNLVKLLKSLNGINDALTKYQASSVSNKDYNDKKKNLENAIKENLAFVATDPRVILQRDRLIRHQEVFVKLSEAEIGLVDAILSANKEAFEQNMENLKQVAPEQYVNFAKQIEQDKFFEIVSKKSKVSANEKQQLSKVSSEGVSKVLYSAYKTKVDSLKVGSAAALKWLVIMGGVLLTAAVIIFGIGFAKKRKKDN